MSKRYWEDFSAGSVTEYGPRPLTREEIIAFAAEFDPQPMHLDEAAARASMLGGLSASGWHSCCLLMRMMADGFLLDSSSMGSPGVDEVRWLAPVRPGDRLTLRVSVMETRASRSRPDMGLVTFGFEMLNQTADIVMTLRTSIMFGRNSSAGGAAPQGDGPSRRTASAAVPPAPRPASRESETRGRYFEDIGIGERAELGRHVFTSEDIKGFASRFDPQLFHTDETEAARSHFGGLCASGWHTAVAWMRLMVDHRRHDDEARRARGEPTPQLGPSPGFRELKWLKPVYAGDILTYTTEVIEMRPSASRPGWGLVTNRSEGVNQHGETAISFVSTVFVERRPG